jgi:hypothetical protein
MQQTFLCVICAQPHHTVHMLAQTMGRPVAAAAGGCVTAEALALGWTAWATAEALALGWTAWAISADVIVSPLLFCCTAAEQFAFLDANKDGVVSR